MTRKKPTDDDTEQACRSLSDWLKADFWSGTDRGQAITIDYLFSMVIRVTAITIVLAASVTVLYSQGQADYSKEFAAENGASLLVEDKLLDSPKDDVLDSSCTKSFFEKNTSVCGHSDDWTSGEKPYLNEVFGLNESFRLNTTIKTTSGDVATISGTDLALGDDVPTNGNVYSWRRTVALDTNGDGNAEWHILQVRTW